MRSLEALRFFLELCALAALAVAGAHIACWLAILMPLFLIVVWGAFIAPKANRRLDDPVRLIVEIAIFLAVGVLLATTGFGVIGVAFATASIAVALTLRLSHSTA
jgi:hypothetical protein